MTNTGATAFAMAVLKDGEVSWSDGFGTDTKDGSPVTGDTLFRVASLTKPMTAVLTLQQVATGCLELDTSVDAYIDDFVMTQQPELASTLMVSDYLMCDLVSSGEPFVILEDIILVTPYIPKGVQWYVNEVPLKSFVKNCGQLGSGGTMVRDGVSCHGYAKYIVDALFPYMVPWLRQDTGTFACSRLHTRSWSSI